MTIIKKFHELCQFNHYFIDLSLFKSYNINSYDLLVVKELMKDLNNNGMYPVPLNFVMNNENKQRNGNPQVFLLI